MMSAALAAVEQLFSKPFRVVFLKMLGVTIIALALCGIGLEKVVLAYVLLPHVPWLAALLHIVAGLGIFVALVFLVTPVSFVVAGLFFDELADHVEAEIAGADRRGRMLPFAQASWVGLKFGLLSICINAVALLLLLVPGVNVIAFFAANAYLLGRGFFELAALRYRPLGEVKDLRRAHGFRILLAGCLCAAVASVPILNLLTPLFATALLVRIAQPLVRGGLPQSAV